MMLLGRRSLKLRFAGAGVPAAVGVLVLALAATAAACGGDDQGATLTMPDPVPEAGAPDVVDASKGPAPLCVDGNPVAWPPGPYEIGITSVLPPDLTFEGPNGTVKLKDYFEPCAPRSRLLVIRSAAAWCGPCGWHASHTTLTLGETRFADRLLLLDLLIADEDNMPPDAAAATRWSKRIDAPPGLMPKVALDAKYTFSTVLPAKNVLPEYVIVDTRTMIVRTVISNPDPQTLSGYVAVELASLDGLPRIDLPERNLHDSLLTDDEFDLLQDMKLPGAPPADPTNEYGDDAAAAALGKTLFADTQLSPSSTVACSTCHDPTKSLADGIPQAIGVSTGDRNSPAIALASHARWQFWDGRADTLWMQALGPFENPKEFASSRVFVVRQIATRYAADYAAVFGAKYTMPDLTDVPSDGKPGDALYDALPQAKRDEITRVYVNVGKAIAAFERTLRVQPNDLDRYVGGDTTAIQGTQRMALQEFFKGGCIQCHWGPRLTDDAFHVIRFPTGRQDGVADQGRAAVLLGLATSEFVASTKWSDAPQAAKPLAFSVVPPSMVGAFKTPTLRGVPTSAPYGHGGVFLTLLDVAKHYGQRAQMVTPANAVGTVEEWIPTFDISVQNQLPQLLDVMTADVIVP
ncbi:MAG: Cytochrome peroxidase [Myxococcaceae bacterium]|nr:Cytochrome peroxidase [Myxococcaceae bacterium]